MKNEDESSEPIKQNKFDNRLSILQENYKKVVQEEEVKLSALNEKLKMVELLFQKRQKAVEGLRKGQELKILENNANLEVI